MIDARKFENPDNAFVSSGATHEPWPRYGGWPPPEPTYPVWIALNSNRRYGDDYWGTVIEGANV